MKCLTPLVFCLLWACYMQSQSNSIGTSVKWVSNHSELKEAITFSLNKESLSNLIKSKSGKSTISIPFFSDVNLQLELYETLIFTENFKVFEMNHNSKVQIQYTTGRHYLGTVKGENNSKVSVSVFEDEISAILRYENKTYNLGRIKDKSNRYILYQAENYSSLNPFKCETIGKSNMDIMKNRTPQKSMSSCTNAVEVYFECDFDMYSTFGSVSACANYVTNIFTEINSIYSAENIPMQISEIVIWTADDPYSDNTNGISDFASSLNNLGFNGDLAHLLTNDPGANGGIAFVDVLCDNNPYAYSDIVNSYQPYPTYSWDVEVIAHELGHNFGSEHTHECVWGPNQDQQIDDCGNIPSGGGPCYDPNNPIVPPSGGTIMSYCHLNSVGINFANGFGQEPGDLIRAKHDSCKCDNSSCQTAKELTESGIYEAHPNNGGGASNSNATNADWYYFMPPENGTVDIYSCGEGVDTRVWLHTGSCDTLIFETISDDDCDMGSGSNYASEILQYNIQAGTKYYIE